MELIRIGLNKKITLNETVVICIGEFDGVHIAHQQLINETIQEARKKKIKSAVMTFDPHPDFVLEKRSYSGYITPLEAKAKLIAAMGIDYLVVVDFSKELANISYQKFEEQILDMFKIKEIIVGFDYHYGYKGLGDIQSLQRKYSVKVINELDYQGCKIGTSLIREHLMNGDLETVKTLLGKNFSIEGKVISGNKIGRTIGIRTANLALENQYYGIKRGVYAVYVHYNNYKYLGVCNIGNNPTFHLAMNDRLEVHILDFDDDIYNEEIEIEFVCYLRDEQIFDSSKELSEQIFKDIERTRQIL